MPESVNPLVPVWYDVVWSASAAAMLVVLVVSLVSLARSAKSLSTPHALAWTLVSIFIPLVGPLAWLFIGRRSAAESFRTKTKATN